MKKTPLIFMLSLLLVVSVNSYVYAADSRDVTEKSYDLQTFSVTVKDADGNKFKVSGFSGASGKTASVMTEYDVTYIGDGYSAATVYGWSKILGAKGYVSMSGGATNTVGSFGHSRTGKTNSYSASKTFLYNVTSILGTHKFYCHGKSYSGSTNWY